LTVAFSPQQLTRPSVCLPNPVYHQVAFACIMLFSIVRAVWLSYQIPRERRTKICRTLLLGVGVFVMGFAVWNLDNFFCTHIREVRDWLTDHGLHHLGHLTQGESAQAPRHPNSRRRRHGD
jgi:dihydroceramidase